MVILIAGFPASPFQSCDFCFFHIVVHAERYTFSSSGANSLEVTTLDATLLFAFGPDCCKDANERRNVLK